MVIPLIVIGAAALAAGGGLGFGLGSYFDEAEQQITFESGSSGTVGQEQSSDLMQYLPLVAIVGAAYLLSRK